MALFTDFFPSPGNDISSNPGVMRGTAGTFTFPTVTTPSVMVTLTGDTSGLTIETGDIASFSFMGVSYSGIVTDTVIARAAGTSVNIALSAPVAFTAGTTTPTFAGGSQTVIEGDSHTGGNTFVAGDTTVQGEITASTITSDTITVGSDGLDGTDGAVGIGIGGGDGLDGSNRYEIEIGSGDYSLVNIGDDSGEEGSETNIYGDMITIGNSNTTDVSISQLFKGDGVRPVRDVAETTAEFDTRTDLFNSYEGNVSTWAEGNDVGIIPVSKIPQFIIGAVHTADGIGVTAEPSLADIMAYLNTAAGPADVYSDGDILIAIGVDIAADPAATPPVIAADAETITFIYTNTTNKTAGVGGGFVENDFHAIAGAGAGVTTITGSTNITVEGDKTTPHAGPVTVELDIDAVGQGELIYNNNGLLDGSFVRQDGGSVLGVNNGVAPIIFTRTSPIATIMTVSNVFPASLSGQGTLTGTGGTLTGVIIATGGNNVSFTPDDIDSNTDTVTIAASTGVFTITRDSLVTISQDVIITRDTELEGSLTLSGFSATDLPTGTETSRLLIDADGLVSVGVGGGELTVIESTDTDITLNSGDDLLILLPITANRAINFPASPKVGTSFEVSNLSSDGSAFRWSIGADGDRVMNTDLTAAFSLDDVTASFKMVYSGAGAGWVIIGAN